MEFIAILFLVIILVILITQGSSTSRQFSRLEAEIHMLRRQLYDLAGDKDKSGKEVPAEKKAVPVTQEQPVQQSVPPPVPAAETPPAAPLPAETGKPIPVFTMEGTITAPGAKTTATPGPKPAAPKQSRDMERFIGENLISKIGIAILVFAIAFFVKYAIDKNWVGETGRVGTGILCGGVLLGLAHRMRNSYKAFSSVLAGGGLAVLYFTITLAYRQFHLFSQPAAFIILIGITAFAALLSLLYNRQELAVIALAGGFASPLLVSTGSGNYQTLFTYIALLNTGILVIAYFKTWRILNIVAFAFTVLLFGTWLVLHADDSYEKARNGFIYATLFYLLFFCISIACNIRENKKFLASDFSILLANTCLYFSAGLYCIVCMKADNYRGLLSAAMGLFNLAAAYLFFRRQKVDTNILYLLIGITLSFISLTAPLQLHGSHITLFWAAEAVLLYWLSAKSGIRLAGLAAQVVWAAMLVSLVWDWLNIYADASERLTILANKGFTTTLFAAASCWLLYQLKRRNATTGKTGMPGKKTALAVAVVLLYISGALELHHQFSHYYPYTMLHVQYLLLYTCLFILVVLAAIRRLQLPESYLPLLLAAAGVLLYVLCIPAAYYTQTTLLRETRPGSWFAVHWLAAAAAGMVMAKLMLLIKNDSRLADRNTVAAWICCALVVLFVSVELHLLARSIFYSTAVSLSYLQRVYVKTGLPIVWGVCSFVFMWLGMRHKYRTLRIVSLTLFTITLAKLFLYDIRNIPAAGKIAAFFCLGVLLLVVSFMYQRLKKIIINDEKKNQ